jgi:hypothetical protein
MDIDRGARALAAPALISHFEDKKRRLVALYRRDRD